MFYEFTFPYMIDGWLIAEIDARCKFTVVDGWVKSIEDIEVIGIEVSEESRPQDWKRDFRPADAHLAAMIETWFWKNIRDHEAEMISISRDVL